MSGSQKTVPSLPSLARLADVYVRCHNEPLLVTPTHTLCIITKAKASTRISTHGHAPPLRGTLTLELVFGLYHVHVFLKL